MDPLRILMGVFLSAAIGALAYKRGSLTASGWLGAIITGTATFGLGGWPHGVTLVFFFVSSTIWSRLKKHQKASLEQTVFEKGSRRDIWQAMANGGLAALICCAVPLWPEHIDTINLLFAATMATVAADTWATELGVLFGGTPRLITTLKPAPKGTSGAISIPGTMAALAAAASTAIVFAGMNGTLTGQFVYIVTLVGVFGCLCDSFLGATVQRLYHGPTGLTERTHGPDGTPLPLVRGWRWLNNDLVNFISSVAGTVLAWCLR
ncbi:MAG: hypothetical protein RLY87_1659 [Chloroflexota bacterium]|jgi:uncharacterized protein (TIGR00297 family)